MEFEFYTYEYLREDGSPWYIGKGKGDRVMQSRPGHRPSKHGITVRFWPDEATALAFERYLINFWGRKDIGTGCLYNRNDGGFGGDTWTGPRGNDKRRLSHPCRGGTGPGALNPMFGKKRPDVVVRNLAGTGSRHPFKPRPSMLGNQNARKRG